MNILEVVVYKKYGLPESYADLFPPFTLVAETSLFEIWRCQYEQLSSELWEKLSQDATVYESIETYQSGGDA